ncbi:MAG TPA: hypothetical protein VLG13_00985 [Patescibacteria group bacterium]|nr:hypothetical protein [Patescibacteria group bacterium]
MPPFRERRVLIDRNLDGDLLKFLRDVGHGHRINIVDASYDIPASSRVFKYPGTSAQALLGIAVLIPVEADKVTIMAPDPGSEDKSINVQARTAFAKGAFALASAYEFVDLGIDYLSRNAEADGELGFYGLANESTASHSFIRTIDELPFACASLVVGHSQKLG